MVEVIARVDLEYEDMVDAGGTPAVRVDAEQKDEENHEEHAAVHA